MVLEHAVEYSAAKYKLLSQPALIRNSQVTVIAMHDTESRLLTMGTGLGLSIVGVALPQVIAKYSPDGWRYAWFLLGGLVCIFSFVCFALLRDNPADKGTAMYGGEEKQRSYKPLTFFSAWGDVVRDSEIWKLGIVYFMFGFSYILYIIIAWWKNTTGFYVSSIVFGLSLSSIPAIMAAAVGDSVGERLAPAALGFITLIFGIGQSLGPAVAGWIKDSTGSFAWAFILSAVVSLMGAAGAMLLRRKEKPSISG
jgi:MFS family permease